MTQSSKKILNVEVTNSTIEELLPMLIKGTIFTPNVDHFVLLQKDVEFYNAYKSANYVLLDSQVLYLLFKLIGKPFKEKISGSDFFPKYCEYNRNNTSVKIFVLGGLDDVARQVQKIINTKYNNEIIVEAYSPSLRFELNENECVIIIEMIKNSGANVLVVGVGAPKQEKWIHHHKHLLSSIDLIMCVGATLDFIAGKQKRAPRFVQKSGFEWAYRLLHQPQRLFYRYVIRDIQIFYYLLLDALHLYKDPFAESK